MLITALKANGVATDTSVISGFGAPTVPAPVAMLSAPIAHDICTVADHRTVVDHCTVRSANASWLYEPKTAGTQKTTANQTFATKRHSQRERPT